MLGDCKIQTILDEVKPNEEDKSYVAVVEDQTCWINLVAFFLKFKILGGPPLHIAMPLLIGLMGVNLESSKMC